MRASEILEDTAHALGFLTRLKLPARWFESSNGTLRSAARAFPLAGAALALPAAVILLAARSLGLPVSVAALLAVASLVAITGALHEDGLADVADGFFGGDGAQRRLEIMKDSAIGSFGAIALILSLGLRILLLSALVERAGAGRAAFALLGVEAASRAAMVWFWQHLPSARPGGVADRSGSPDASTMRHALAAGAAIAAITVLPAAGLWALVLATLLAAASVFGLASLCQQKIAGQTGDTLGAAQQVAAMSLLAGLVVAL